jgi:hypothetical protein
MGAPRQTVQVDLHGLELRTGAKRLQAGRTTVTQNTRQRQRGVYGKRDGHSDLVKTTDSGSITSSLGLVSAGGALTLRTATDAFIYDAVRTKWLNRGKVARAMSSYAAVTTPVTRTATGGSPGSADAYKPSQITCNGYRYHFSAAIPDYVTVVDFQLSVQEWTYRVTDATTGAEIVPRTTIPTCVGWQAKPVVIGTNVWLFVGAKLKTGFRQLIYVAKFDTTAPATAPVVTVYVDLSAQLPDPTDEVLSWDVLGTGAAAVVVVGLINGATLARHVAVSKLDTATGVLAASPGWVVTAALGLTLSSQLLSIVRNEVGSTYYALIRDSASGWRGLTIVASTLVTTVSAAIASLTAAHSMVCAYRDQSSGNIIAFASTPGTTPETSIVTRVSMTAAFLTPTSAVLKRACSVVAEPIQVGTTWCLPVIHDDNGTSLQRGYLLLDATTGNVMARALHGLGGDIYQHAAGTLTAADMGWIAPVQVSGNVIALDLNAFDGTTYSVMDVRFDLGASPQSGTAMQGQAANFAGGWPAQVVGGATAVDYLSMFPRDVVPATTTAGINFPPAGIYSVAVCYLYEDVAGNVTRSAPSATKTVTLNGTTQNLRVTVPTLRLTNTAAGIYGIDFYISVAGQTVLYRQRAAANDPTVDTIFVDFTTQSLKVGTEIIYTASGELANDPPPPHQLGSSWGRRVILSGTDVNGEFWVSKELEAGKGVQFSLGLVYNIPGDTGAVRAQGAIDQNYFAFLKQDGLWVIQSGAGGPDVMGRGSYEPVRLKGNRGTTNPIVLQTKAGLYFQDNDGKVVLIDGALEQIEQVSDGMYGYRTQAITGAVDLPAQQQARFYLADGTCLVLDYGNVSESNPNGEWSLDTNTSGAGGACLHSSAPYHAAADGTVGHEITSQWFDGTSTPILPKVKVPLSLAGVRGISRVKRGQFVGQWKGRHDLRVTLDVYDGVAGEPGSTTQVCPTKTVLAGPELFEFRPNSQLITAFDVTIEHVGTDLTEGGTLEGLAFEVTAGSGGLPPIDVTQRL